MKSTLIFSSATLLLFVGQAFAETTPHISEEKQRHYEKISRSLVERLWKTNDCFVAVNPFHSTNPAWTYHRGVWTNEFRESRVYVSRLETSKLLPWERVRIDFNFTVTNLNRYCYFDFLDDGSDRVLLANNPLYRYSDVFYKYGDWKPLHTDEQQARLKAAEYAAMFGVSDLWDKTKFELRSFDFDSGVWSFHFTPFVNGYPTLYAVSVRVADLPGYPLGEWFSGLYQIPANLPVKVVLTSEQAQKKATAYLKKYFPLKHLIPRLTFHSNRLEYITPNYNYIRPADDSGFSDYKPRHDEVALVWANTFKKPDGEGFPWVTIYVDAATGKMLGGSD